MNDNANRSAEAEILDRCDSAVETAASVMRRVGADMGMIIDRMLTYGAALACAQRGSAATAAIFRQLADRIDAGAFASLDKEHQGSRH